MTTVLVADDSPDIRALVRITLASQGWTVIEAATPRAAVEVAQRERPDTILLDVVFEGEVEDGFTVCRTLRASPVVGRTPILMLTAQTTGAARALADTSGATAFLAKPFGPIELIATVRDLLNVRGTTPPLGLVLIEDGRITPTQLESALEEQRRLAARHVEMRLGEILVRRGLVSQHDVEHALARQQALAAPRAATIRVVIADDHLAIRDGLRAVLSDDDGFDVVGVATDGDEALTLIRERRPHVAVLDQEMPKRTGLDVLREIRAEKIATSVVMFSFEARLRDRALREGASAFLTKDAQPKELTAAVRRASGIDTREPVKVSLTGALGVSHTAWRVVVRQRQAAALIGALAVAYAGSFLVLEPAFGASAAVLAVVAAAIAGALLGPEAGAIAGVALCLVTFALWAATGHAPGEPVLTIGGNGLGAVLTVVIGAGFGVMRLLGGRIDPHDRRIGALIESSLTLSGAAPATLALVADAARQMVPAHALLLYARAADGSVRVVAVSGVPSGVIGHREVARSGTVHRAFADGRARAFGPHEARSFLSSARSGVVVPAAPVGEDTEGVMVALSERRKPLDASDAATLARLAPSVWLALKLARRQDWWGTLPTATVRRSREAMR